MLLGKEIIESVLHENLIEFLNAEIVLGTVNSVQGIKVLMIFETLWNGLDHHFFTVYIGN